MQNENVGTNVTFATFFPIAVRSPFLRSFRQHYLAFESRENGIDIASSVVNDVEGGIADDEVHQDQMVVGSLTNNLFFRNKA